MDGGLLAIFVLLLATVLLVPLAKWAGLGTIIGYLAAGVLIGPFGLSLISDTETIRSVSEFGVVMMLFLIGLEVDPSELWRMRNHVVGMGLSQMLGTSAVLSLVLLLAGFSWPGAITAGLALAMSSTAIAMQMVGQRSITRTDTGRATLAILLVQDVSVIPILAAIPVLAALGGATGHVADSVHGAGHAFTWWTAIGLIAAFGGALLGSRYVIRPMMRWIALTKVSEAFTAFALALVVGAALLTESFGLSPALGAFLGGVLLADSEYRHELQSNLEPFKGLLLGLFFISVGMSIAFDVVFAQPLMVLALVAAVLALKMAVLFVLATFFKMHTAERLLLGALLSQAGEFAFVVLQFAGDAGSIEIEQVKLLTVVVALSMAATPLVIFLFDRVWLPRFNAGAETPPMPAPETINARDKVMVLGYGRFGQIVTRMLRAQGFEMTLIDDDPAQIELVKRFGVKVFYGDGGRLDILRAAGAEDARMIVIAVAGGERILEIARLIRRHYPKVMVAARAVDRSHAHDLMALGVEVFERETFQGALRLGEKALVALGRDPADAHHVAQAFEDHDTRLLYDSYVVRNDQAAYIGFVRRSTEMLDQVMRSDRQTDPPGTPAPRSGAPPTDAPKADIDNGPDAASQ